MAMVEDLSAFMNTDHFATQVQIGSLSVAGIFDAAHAEVFGMVSGTRPVLLVASADVEDASIGDVVTIDETSYTLARMEADGTGLTRLILEAV